MDSLPGELPSKLGGELGAKSQSWKSEECTEMQMIVCLNIQNWYVPCTSETGMDM